ncbi:MAG TPA: hypothetical protein VNA16_04000 [Abditibacteriaceae bacterium]|nr:hypothetical protein [Abditibacteriaceae bacterium]
MDIFSREADVVLRSSATADDGVVFMRACMTRCFNEHVELLQSDGGPEFKSELALRVLLRDPSSTRGYCCKHFCANRSRAVLGAPEYSLQPPLTCGSTEQAESLVDAWQNIASATHCVRQIRQKGFSAVMPLCGVSMRWIRRPLVPQPKQLADLSMTCAGK